MKIKVYFALLMSIIIITSCEFQPHHHKSKVNKINTNLDWLQGTWEQPTENGILSESWRKMNDTVYEGIGLLIQDDDTLFSESLSIYQSQSFWYYAALVSDQNEGEAIVFKLTSAEDSIWVFENKAHDFPQDIYYQRIKSDSLIATVTGKGKNGPRTEIFRMKKK